MDTGGFASETPSPPPPVLPKIDCPECGFKFVIGEIAVATCPMCSAEVQTGFVDDDPADAGADGE